jgi:hypothetical protein
MIVANIGDFNQSTSATTFAMAVGTVSVGDLVIIFTHQGNGDCTSITDNLGNTYTKAYAYSWFWYEDVYYSTITVAGSSTLTATSGAAGYLTAQAWRATGMQSTPLDKTAGNEAGSTTPSVTMPSATATTYELVFGMFINYAATPTSATPSSGWTKHSSYNSTDGDTMDVLYQGTTATGTYSPGGTYSTSQSWDGLLVSFKGNSALVSGTLPNLFFF